MTAPLQASPTLAARTTRSTCCYCGVGCGVLIETALDGNGIETIVGVQGDSEHPANFGRLCSKGSTLHLTATPALRDQARALRRALEKCEFVVLQDAYAHTATAPYADVLLPASSWGEKEGTVTNSERRISRVRAAVAPPVVLGIARDTSGNYGAGSLFLAGVAALAFIALLVLRGKWLVWARPEGEADERALGEPVAVAE